MADDVLAQLVWPLQEVRLPDGTVTFAQCDQGSDLDLESRAAVVLCTPKGHRDDDPAFGRSEMRWRTTVDVARLAAEVNASDPALDIDAEEVTVLAEATHRLIYTDVQAA